MRLKALIPPALLALTLVVAGCGSEAGGDETTPGDAEEPAQATDLEILVWPEGEGTGEAVRYTLRCDPPAGEHPDPAAACAALQELGVGAFAPVPPDVACTQEYGGPQQAQVRGTIAGETVDARLAYTDGCEIARWNALAAVVPGSEGALR
jgi:hypothetical protein